MSVTIKAACNDEIRKFKVDPEVVTLKDLQATIARLYSLPAQGRGVCFRYDDCDGDTISLSSGDEIAEAMLSAKETNDTLRLAVIVPDEEMHSEDDYEIIDNVPSSPAVVDFDTCDLSETTLVDIANGLQTAEVESPAPEPEVVEFDISSLSGSILADIAAAHSVAEEHAVEEQLPPPPPPAVEECKTVAVEVGPIWGQEHALQVAEQYLLAHPGHSWTAHWWTTVPGEMSVLQINMPLEEAEKVESGEVVWRYPGHDALPEPEVVDFDISSLSGSILADIAAAHSVAEEQLPPPPPPAVEESAAEECKTVAVEVGPIWGQEHALQVAAHYLLAHPSHAWKGHWNTTLPQQMSVLYMQMPLEDARTIEAGELVWRYPGYQQDSEACCHVTDGQEWWSPAAVELSDTPITIEYDVKPLTETSECIGAFSGNRAPWGSDEVDALSWYGAPHRKDFTFRTKMFATFPSVNEQPDRQPLSAGQWHHFTVSITRLSATYSVDGLHYATAAFEPGCIPEAGHVGMIRYASDYCFKNMQIRNAENVLVFSTHPEHAAEEVPEQPQESLSIEEVCFVPAAPELPEWKQELQDLLVDMGFANETVAPMLAATSDQISIEEALDRLATMPPVAAESAPEMASIWNPEWDSLVAELEEHGFPVSREELTEVVRSNCGQYKACIKEMLRRERESRQ
jgi:hypothetical protein